jgi:hypothetical protein
MQAQEYPSARWAVGLRMRKGATAAVVERAFNDGHILRTHVLRPTWHFVTAADIHWMLELTASRVQRGLAYGYRQFGLDIALRARGAKVIERALSREDHLSRVELGARLARAGIVMKGVPLALLTIHAELEGIICSGPRVGRQSTYALLSKRAPRPKRLSREESIAELTVRYFRSHGPATVRDFVWWSGLSAGDARRGLEINGARSEAIDGRTYWMLEPLHRRESGAPAMHLLPVYDEYLVAYQDLEAVPRAKGNWGRLQQALLSAGQVAGTWKAVVKDGAMAVQVTPLGTLTKVERDGLPKATGRYERFMKQRS